MERSDRIGIMKNLRQSLADLSLPGPAALRTQPEGSCRADELALEFDNWLQAALANCRDELSPFQWEALESINRALSEMSGEKNSSLWTDEAVGNHPKWVWIRAEAAKALREFN